MKDSSNDNHINLKIILNGCPISHEIKVIWTRFQPLITSTWTKLTWFIGFQIILDSKSGFTVRIKLSFQQAWKTTTTWNRTALVRTWQNEQGNVLNEKFIFRELKNRSTFIKVLSLLKIKVDLFFEPESNCDIIPIRLNFWSLKNHVVTIYNQSMTMSKSVYFDHSRLLKICRRKFNSSNLIHPTAWAVNLIGPSSIFISRLWSQIQ